MFRIKFSLCLITALLGAALAFVAPPSHSQLMQLTGAGKAPGGGAPPVTVIWDFAGAGSNFSFSDTNQVATKSASGWSSVKADTSKNSGKLYYELTNNSTAGCCGQIAAMAATANTNFLPCDNGGQTALCKDFRAGNGVEASGTASVTASTLAPVINAGDVIGFAIDFTAGEIYMSINNDFTAFKAGSSPSTSTNPIGTFTAGTAMMPGAGANGDLTGDVIIKLRASGTYTYSPPSGYSSFN